MGNQPNNLIQCGQDQKDYKQETFTTREQAIRQNKGQHIFKQQPLQSKTSTTIIGSENSQPSTPASQGSLPKPPSRLASRNAFPSIPEHQNLTRVSKTPKNLYLIVGNGELYEEERGKCLDEIIESRYNTTMHFPDYQIHGLLECLVYSLAYMVRKNIPHHDFYPTNIFYNNGVFKLLNPMLIKNSAYSLTQQRKRFSFLSPELILEVLNDTPYQSISKDVINKSDVFAIGMILLEFCTLTPSSECYDPETYSIVDSIINERVDKTRSLYNPLIADCIDLMLQYEVDKRIPPIELAYAVHAKVREVKTDEEQMSRVQQMSRMTMSGKPPMIPQPHVMPPQPQGIPPERVLVQAPPPGFLGQDPTQVTPNAQPYLVSGNPKTMPPSSNLPSFPYFNPNVLPPNMSSYPNIRNIPGAQVNPAINPMIPQQRLPPQPAGYPKTDFELSGGYRKPQNSYFVTSENKPQEPKFNYPEPPRPESSNLPKPSLLPTSNTKLKLNPFEQIQEDLKEDEDESPQKYKINVNTLAGQTRPQEFSTTFPASPSANSSPKQYKFKSSEYAAMYNLKSPTNPTSTATTTTTGTTSGFGYSSNKEQTLDQRVRRILEASKHIK